MESVGSMHYEVVRREESRRAWEMEMKMVVYSHFLSIEVCPILGACTIKVRWWEGGRLHTCQSERSVNSNGYAEWCFREVVDKGSEERSTIKWIIRALSFTHLIALATVLSTTTVQSSFQARTIQCILRGQSGNGELKNQIRIWMYAEQSAVCTGWDVGYEGCYQTTRSQRCWWKLKAHIPHP